MSSVAKQLKFLNKISSTTKQAQILLDATKYSGVKLTFQVENHHGHMGARKFWREYLPTLQFYNPNFRIDVIRIKNENTKFAGVPCTLEIVSNEDKVIKHIDMRNKTDDIIMKEFLEKVEHEPVPEESLVKV
ncbi:hypothetical protein HG536_0B03480 [Torulaspora globosa]|uniref:Ribosomal protein/NADH dehydrogenase domain-containing protein n=1 Tax=Torulaspora globosa TaxID=48254 RepID=A0A7G3ZD99_9SACH|nr:uncharacterized protein HG536_0B03480 [Torulaspora globosa]QLL31485.1 hypothetical protein HG536_0B03480 [Torulaspora globosa]